MELLRITKLTVQRGSLLPLKPLNGLIRASKLLTQCSCFLIGEILQVPCRSGEARRWGLHGSHAVAVPSRFSVLTLARALCVAQQRAHGTKIVPCFALLRLVALQKDVRAV